MGSNVSRRSGKSFPRRRVQSSGSLYRMLAPRGSRAVNSCGDDTKERDGSKFFGSLPNHLDEKRFYCKGNGPENLRSREVSCHDDCHRDSAGGDQGYGSEWSPGDDWFLSSKSSKSTLLRYSTVRRNSDVAFITKGNTFQAKFKKGSRGLGLSVTGGIDSASEHPGLIRIKRLFPHHPASECGILQLGDIILEANGIPLTGLTNHEALEILRTTPSTVQLKICRPPGDTFFVTAASVEEPPFFPSDTSHCENLLLPSQCNDFCDMLPMPLQEPYGEFDVILKKINGSLGFTLRKEDESILGHYVRALVREPAISDGRICPGDKIVSVNGNDISHLSHEEAVSFLRRCGDEVRLRLYRDPAQTPVAALSPEEPHRVSRPKPALRKEARDMLCTLAVKKMSPAIARRFAHRSRWRNSSPGASPRRRKLIKCPPNEDAASGKANGGVLEIFADAQETPEERKSPQDGGKLTSLLTVLEPLPEFVRGSPMSHSSARPSPKFLNVSPCEQRQASQGLLKWKGIVFASEEKNESEGGADDSEKKETFPGTFSADPRGESLIEERSLQVLTVELCKGWNTRLGFSLTSSRSKTIISAIYPDSVAAKDGRLRPGDEIIMINDESVEGMITSNVIEVLRKARGATAITVVRSYGNESGRRGGRKRDNCVFP